MVLQQSDAAKTDFFYLKLIPPGRAIDAFGTLSVILG